MEESEKSFIIASINIVIEAEKEEEKKADGTARPSGRTAAGDEG